MPDSQVLVEKIVRLQRHMARKQEKLDFLEEHMGTMTEEVKKKNRIIVEYVMKAEAGIADRAATNHIVAKLLCTTKKSNTLPLQVGEVGAKMSPPTSFSQPMSVKSSGVQFQSPANTHRPWSCHKVNAMASNRRKLQAAVTPTAEAK